MYLGRGGEIVIVVTRVNREHNCLKVRGEAFLKVLKNKGNIDGIRLWGKGRFPPYSPCFPPIPRQVPYKFHYTYRRHRFPLPLPMSRRNIEAIPTNIEGGKEHSIHTLQPFSAKREV